MNFTRRLLFVCSMVALSAACGSGGPAPGGMCTGPDKELLTDAVVAVQANRNSDQVGERGLTFSLSDTHIYWIDPDDGVPTVSPLTGSSGAVKRVPKEGGAVETFFSAPADRQLVEVVVANNEVFVLYASDNTNLIGRFLGKVTSTSTTVTPLNASRVRGWDSLETGLGGFRDGSIWVSTMDDEDDPTDREGQVLRIDPTTGAETVVYDSSKKPTGFTGSISVAGWAGTWGTDLYLYMSQGIDGLWKVDQGGAGVATAIVGQSTGLLNYGRVGAGYLITGMNGIQRHELTFMDTVDFVNAPEIFDTRAYLDRANVLVHTIDGDRAVVARSTDGLWPAYYVPVDGSAATPIVCDGEYYESLQTDGTHWYWIDGEHTAPLRAFARAPR